MERGGGHQTRHLQSQGAAERRGVAGQGGEQDSAPGQQRRGGSRRNTTVLQVMGGLGGSVACGVRVENWSRYRLSAPRLASGATGRPASSWPLRPVLPSQADGGIQTIQLYI